MGTYNRLEGKQAEDDCIDCSAGYYCSEEGKDKLVSKDECPAKYFCPARTSDYTDHPCTAGVWTVFFVKTLGHDWYSSSFLVVYIKIAKLQILGNLQINVVINNF